MKIALLSLLLLPASRAFAEPVEPPKKLLKLAKDLDIPFSDIAKQVTEACPLGPGLDELDRLLLELPVKDYTKTEMKSRQERAEAAAERRQERYDAEHGAPGTSSPDIGAVAQHSYSGMVSAGASHGAALAASSQQAGFGALSAAYEAEIHRHRERAPNYKELFKETRQNSVKFLCHYRQGDWEKAWGDGGAAANSLLIARAGLRGAGADVRSAATWYASGFEHIEHLPWTEAQKLALYEETVPLWNVDAQIKPGMDVTHARELLSVALRFHRALPNVARENVRGRIKKLMPWSRCRFVDPEVRDPSRPGYFKPGPLEEYCHGLWQELGVIGSSK